MLRERGHLVEIAGNGREAIDLTERNRYRVILMDVQMPDMNGLEATAAIRTRESGNRHTPIVALTAHSMPGDSERCLAAGMDAYISKPIQRAELIAMVERMAEKGLEIKDEGFENFDSDHSSFIPHPSSFIPHPSSAVPASSSFNLADAQARLGGGLGLFREMAQFFFSDGLKLMAGNSGRPCRGWQCNGRREKGPPAEGNGALPGRRGGRRGGHSGVAEILARLGDLS